MIVDALDDTRQFQLQSGEGGWRREVLTPSAGVPNGDSKRERCQLKPSTKAVVFWHENVVAIFGCYLREKGNKVSQRLLPQKRSGVRVVA
jgi:hypothetical protein